MAMFVGCFYLVHFRLMPNIMAGKFTVMASIGMGEGGGLSQNNGRQSQGGGVLVPGTAIQETQLDGQACEVVKVDNDNEHLHIDPPEVHKITNTCDAGHEGAGVSGNSQGSLHAPSSTPLAWAR